MSAPPMQALPKPGWWKRNWKWFRAAAFVALLVLNAGCSGIRAQKSISILDLLLPGITRNDASAKQDERDGDIRQEFAAQ